MVLRGHNGVAALCNTTFCTMRSKAYCKQRKEQAEGSGRKRKVHEKLTQWSEGMKWVWVVVHAHVEISIQPNSFTMVAYLYDGR